MRQFATPRRPRAVMASLAAIVMLAGCSSIRPLGGEEADRLRQADPSCDHHLARANAALAVPADSAGAIAAAHAEHAQAMHEYHHCLAASGR